jgi:hypothetical protein
MTQNPRTQSLVFNQFDGKTGAALFFDSVRERAYTANSTYSPAAVDGTLPWEQTQNILDDDLHNNIQQYASLYSEISRSLTHTALITKRRIDISEAQSGYLLLEALKTAAGQNNRLAKSAKLESFLDLKMPNKQCNLLDWINIFTTTASELETRHEIEVTEMLLLTTLRRSITFTDKRYSDLLSNIYLKSLTYEETIEFLTSHAELQVAHGLDDRMTNNGVDMAAMLATLTPQQLQALQTLGAQNQTTAQANFASPGGVTCFRCGQVGHIKANCTNAAKPAASTYTGPPCTLCTKPHVARSHGKETCVLPGGGRHNPDKWKQRQAKHAARTTGQGKPHTAQHAAHIGVTKAQEPQSPPQISTVENSALKDIFNSFGICMMTDMYIDTESTQKVSETETHVSPTIEGWYTLYNDPTSKPQSSQKPKSVVCERTGCEYRVYGYDPITQYTHDRFCSRTCAQAHLNKSNSIETTSRFRTNDKKQCARDTCTFDVYGCDMPSGKVYDKYCSRRCARIQQQDEITDEFRIEPTQISSEEQIEVLQQNRTMTDYFARQSINDTSNDEPDKSDTSNDEPEIINLVDTSSSSEDNEHTALIVHAFSVQYETYKETENKPNIYTDIYKNNKPYFDKLQNTVEIAYQLIVQHAQNEITDIFHTRTIISNQFAYYINNTINKIHESDERNKLLSELFTLNETIMYKLNNTARELMNILDVTADAGGYNAFVAPQQQFQQPMSQQQFQEHWSMFPKTNDMTCTPEVRRKVHELRNPTVQQHIPSPVPKRLRDESMSYSSSTDPTEADGVARMLPRRVSTRDTVSDIVLSDTPSLGGASPDDTDYKPKRTKQAPKKSKGQPQETIRSLKAKFEDHKLEQVNDILQVTELVNRKATLSLAEEERLRKLIDTIMLRVDQLDKSVNQTQAFLHSFVNDMQRQIDVQMSRIERRALNDRVQRTRHEFVEGGEAEQHAALMASNLETLGDDLDRHPVLDQIVQQGNDLADAFGDGRTQVKTTEALHFSQFIVDSGCSHHMFGNKSCFSSYETTQVNVKIKGIGDHKPLTVAGIGTVAIYVANKQKALTLLEIQDVWHVPGSNHNLLSVSQFLNRGASLTLTRDFLLTTSTGIEIPLMTTNGLYILSGILMHKLIEHTPEHKIHALLGTRMPPNISNTDINHRRLAHINPKAMKRTYENSIGLLPMSKNEAIDFCDTCAKTRIKQLNVPHQNKSTPVPPLHTFQTDYWGPFTNTQKDGSTIKSYMNGYICVTTGFAIVFFCKSKSTTKENLESVQIIVDYLHQERLRNAGINEYEQIKIRTIQGDFENLFAGNSFREWATHLSINTRFSAPYNHAQNGKIESFWYNIAVMGSSLLSYANIEPDSFFWAYAVRHAVHLWNTTVHSEKEKSPYEIVTTKQPDFTYDKIWGCPAYYLKTEEQKTKIGERGILGYYLGKDTSTKDAYYIYDPKINKVLTRRDVIFDEGWQFRADKHKILSPFPIQDINNKENNNSQHVESEQKTQQHKNHGPDQHLTQYENDDNSDSDTKSDFDLDEHYEITSKTDRFGYTRIKEQISDDTFLVEWPDTNNITASAIKQRENVEPVPYEVETKQLRDDGNYNVSWKPTVESIDNLSLTDISKFQSQNTITHQYIAKIENNTTRTPDKLYYAFINTEEIITPSTYDEAFHSLQKDDWIQAMDNEMSELENAHTWHLVPETEAKNIITGKWVFKIKYSNGKLQKYKARYCARGFTQRKGIDYDEIFSPVARSSTINSMLALANQNKEYIYIIDVRNAFVQTPTSPDIELYLTQPKGYERYDKDGNKLVCKLDKYLYGLLQASREFNKLMQVIFTENMQFTQSASDTCLYTRNASDPNKRTTLTIYVDDIIITAPTLEILDEFYTYIKTRFPVTINKLTNNQLAQILGIEIQYLREEGILNLYQKHSIIEALERFGFKDLPVASTPIEYNWHPELHSTTNTTEIEIFPIRETIGKLNDISLHTRPDITFAVSRCQREMHKPTYSLIVAIKRIFRYLKGTLEFKTTFRRNNNYGPMQYNITNILTSYSDATWGVWDEDIQITMKSTSGHYHTLFDTPVSWGTILQRGKPAQSSGESEYIAGFHTATESTHLKHLLIELGIEDKQQTLKIYTDSESCIGMSKNPINHKRNKHIMLKYHWIRQATENKEIKLLKISAAENPADLFTKAVKTVKIFNILREIIFKQYFKTMTETNNNESS